MPSRTIIGFHGTGAAVAAGMLDGTLDLRSSANPHDWIGRGIYFWEGDARRAVHFVQHTARRLRRAAPPVGVVGAEIDLGRCLDLTTQDGIDLVVAAHARLKALKRAAGDVMPRNAGTGVDRPLRALDCEVVNTAHEIAHRAGYHFDSVRAAFREGRAAYPGAAFTRLAHIQVAIVNSAMIRRLFDPAVEGYLLA